MPIKVMNIHLENFKSFSDVNLNLENKKATEAKKLACIYGENGSGKTNIIDSISFLIETLQTRSWGKFIQDKLPELKKEGKLPEEFINELMQHNINMDISTLCKNYHYIDNDNLMKVKYEFLFMDKPCEYILFIGDDVTYEKLSYKINTKVSEVFVISNDSFKISPSIFKNKKYNTILKEKVKQYWGKHTFLSIITAEIGDKNKHYIEENVDTSLILFIKELSKISVVTKENNGEAHKMAAIFPLEVSQPSGFIPKNQKNLLLSYQKLLSLFFTSVYVDIDGIYYKFEERSKNQLKFTLYAQKRMNGELKNIPFDIESSGTKKLLQYFMYLLNCLDGQTVFVDEMDDGIHDLLFAKIIDSLRDVMQGQLVITTHNTTLLEYLNPKEVYVIQKDIDANTIIECVNNYQQRTQRTNSIRSKYLRGDYEGIPHVDAFDAEFLHEQLLEFRNTVVKTRA